MSTNVHIFNVIMKLSCHNDVIRYQLHQTRFIIFLNHITPDELTIFASSHHGNIQFNEIGVHGNSNNTDCCRTLLNLNNKANKSLGDSNLCPFTVLRGAL